MNKTDGALQHFLIAYPCRKVEMDFVFTRDSELVWTHNPIVNGRLVNRSYYRDVKELLTLEDVLTLLDGNVDLLLEIKYFNGKKDSLERLIRALELVLKYDKEVSLQSFNAELVKGLLKHKDSLNDIQIGLIINLFKTLLYRKGKADGLEGIDFLSLSSELWEKGKFKDDYKLYRELFPSALEYAWTWETIYREDERRINGYIGKGANGIITSNPTLVRSLIKD